MQQEENDFIERLILAGALEVSGIDMETGEPLYNFTEKLKDVNPDLHSEVSTYFSRETMALWQYGFISMDITMPNPLIKVTPKAFDKQEVDKLDPQHQYSLKEIIRIIMSEND